METRLRRPLPSSSCSPRRYPPRRSVEGLAHNARRGAERPVWLLTSRAPRWRSAITRSSCRAALPDGPVAGDGVAGDGDAGGVVAHARLAVLSRAPLPGLRPAVRATDGSDERPQQHAVQGVLRDGPTSRVASPSATRRLDSAGGEVHPFSVVGPLLAVVVAAGASWLCAAPRADVLACSPSAAGHRQSLPAQQEALLC